MSLFYERRETQEEIRISYTSFTAFYIWTFLILGIGMICVSSEFASILLLIIYGFFGLFLLIGIRKATRELKNAKRKGILKRTGSLFSIANPKTFIIKKDKD